MVGAVVQRQSVYRFECKIEEVLAEEILVGSED